MSIGHRKKTVREVVGVFHQSEDLQAAIGELLASGFHRVELSLLASEQSVGRLRDE